MSEETVEQVRRAYDTFNRRDWDAFRRLMDRDVRVESRPGAVSEAAGLDEDDVADLAQLLDLDPVVGHSSGTPIVDPFWQAIELKDGRCTWWRNCSSEAEALEAIAARSSSA
jgi:hypothetical protein